MQSEEAQLAIINGTSGNDYLPGTSGNDTINGFDGNDRIEGGAGNDTINPGTSVGGTDSINPGTGVDTIDFSDREGGLGFAFVDLGWFDPSAGFGGDSGLTVVIDGENNFGFISGPDISVTFVDVSKGMLNGPFGGLEIQTGRNDGDDEFYVDPGEGNWLALSGGMGWDQFHIGENGFLRLEYYTLSQGIVANLGMGIITRNYAVDSSLGASFTLDRITGPGHVSELYGTNFNDRIAGSRHDERFILGQGNDVLNGKGGIDIVRYDRNCVTAVEVDLAKGTAKGAWGGQAFTDRLKNIENVRGSLNDADKLYGDDADNGLDGRGGNDTLLGRGGSDQLLGGEGNDKLDGGFGDDVLSGQGGLDKFIFKGNFGHDTITDFDASKGAEDINLRGVSSIVNFVDLKNNHMSQVGADVVIDAGGGNVITLLDVSLAQLDKSDFIF